MFLGMQAHAHPGYNLSAGETYPTYRDVPPASPVLHIWTFMAAFIASAIEGMGR